ncbi:integrase domain-containing protein [Polaromonas sp. P1(28)-13]|nr:integrase domain-containing protein [Polaromonas sp. P1(28)-13]
MTQQLELTLSGAKEPSAREVNRQITADLKSAKRSAQAKRAGTGAGMSVLERAQHRYKKNPKAQMAMFFGEFTLRAGTGRARSVSERTRTLYADELIRMLDDLRELRASVQDIGEIGKSHAVKLIKHWGSKGQAASTIQNKISILRRFLTFIGKDSAIPKGQDLKTWLNQQGVTAPVTRQNIPTESKAWDENQVDLHKVLAELSKESAITAIQLEVQAAFGLRMKESIQLNPQASDCGTFLRVLHGTKGGLPRDVDFDDDPAMREWQRDVLERAKLYAQQNRKGTLSLQGKRLDQSKAHFYYQCRKVGITRDQLGVTAHGLRHQYAARRYARLAGMGAPVTRNAPLHVTDEVRSADLAAREQVSRELGHFRPDITQAYTGSLPMMEKGRKQRIRDWVERTEENPAFQTAMKDAGVVSVWMGGRFAMGLEVEASEKFRLIVQTSSRQPLDGDARFMLKQRLIGMYDRAIDLSEHFEAGQPDDVFELMVH